MDYIFSQVKNNRNKDICTICLNNLTPNELLLNCNQCQKIIHQKCAKKWLKYKMECPNCRYKKNTIEIVYNDHQVTRENCHIYQNINMYYRALYFGMMGIIFLILFIILLIFLILWQ